jgi:hypothetical protein
VFLTLTALVVIRRGGAESSSSKPRYCTTFPPSLLQLFLRLQTSQSSSQTFPSLHYSATHSPFSRLTDRYFATRDTHLQQQTKLRPTVPQDLRKFVDLLLACADLLPRCPYRESYHFSIPCLLLRNPVLPRCIFLVSSVPCPPAPPRWRDLLCESAWKLRLSARFREDIHQHVQIIHWVSSLFALGHLPTLHLQHQLTPQQRPCMAHR